MPQAVTAKNKKMVKNFKFFLLVFCFFFYLAAVIIPLEGSGYQLGPAPAYRFEESRGSGKPYFFWQVEGKNNKAYILGSIHVAKEGIYPLSREIEEAFKQAEVLAVEVDLSRVDELDVAVRLAPRAIYRDGTTLKDNLSSDLYYRAGQQLKDMGIDIETFVFYQPWFLALNLASQALFELGFCPDWGVDNYFLRRAKKNGKKIKSLESLEYQISLFADLPHDLQELFLFSALTEIETIERQINVLFDAWEKGNKRRLETILQRGLRRYPELKPFYEKVFYQRNRNMVSQIAGYLESGKVHFVVVGAGHLVGQEGIIQLLRKKGYHLTQY